MAANRSNVVKPNEAAPGARTLVMTRMFDAPRRLVFKCWTEPDHLARWWGCAGSTVTTFKGEFRAGGAFRVVMHLTDGSDHRVRGVFREIEAPERLVFTWAWEDAEGRLGHETLVTVSFAERGAKTQITLRHAVFESVPTCDLHRAGWAASFDRLAGYLSEAQAA